MYCDIMAAELNCSLVKIQSHIVLSFFKSINLSQILHTLYKQFQVECIKAVTDSSTTKVEQEQEEEEEEEEEGEENNIKQERRKSCSHVEQETKASGHNKEAKEPNSIEHKGK